MQLTLLFFGVLTDVTGVSSIDYILDNADTNTLKNKLHEEYPELKKYTYKIAVNQDIITENKILKDGDEVAFLPPFSGG